MSFLIPKQIDIEVTSACNLKCLYCPGLGTKPRHIDVDLFKSIIDRVDFPTTIVPWLNGEPLLHPQYLELLKYTDEHNLRYYITTNGTVYKQDVFDYITRGGTNCYQIIVSLDGLPGSNSIHLARPGTQEKTVYRTIDYLVHNKKGNIDIAVKICRRGQDWEEIEKYISFWLKYGVDYVCVGDSLIEDKNKVGFRKYPCQYSDNNFMVIKVDGRLVRCAYNVEATNNEKYSFGVVDKETPLLELYNQPELKEFREKQRNGIFEGPCLKCGFPYTGQGFAGMITFRDQDLIQEDIYYHRDYYNQFFSLKKKLKKPEYYRQGYSSLNVS